MMLSQVTNFLKKNKKVMYYLGLFALMYFALGDSVFASDVEGEKSDFAEGFNAFIQIISVGIGMIGNLIGVFLNPGWTNATGIGLHTILKDLWIMVSNIVYVIFAILIVVIAFMNILGKEGTWELKQALPKFVIGVLIVPFSWFFVQLIVSMSTVLSASVLALPYDSFYSKNTNGLTSVMEQKICTTYVHIQTGEGSAAKTQSGCGAQEKNVEDMIQGEGMYGILSVYTYGIFSVDQVTELKTLEVESFSSLFKIGVNLVLVLVLFLIYFILMVSLGLALFTRGIWLWLYMIFSPVFGLLYFFGKEKDGFMEGKFSISEFIGLAMIPVYVSAALSFGLLFVFVAGKSFTVGETNQGTTFLDYEVIEPRDYGDGLVSTTKGTRISFLGEYHMDMFGGMGTSTEKGLDTLDVMKSGVGTLIVQMFGLAVLWIAVMAALNQSKITGAVIEPIASFGKQVGGLIAKSPQYAPVFGGQSMASLKTAGGSVTSSMQTKQNTMGNNFAEKHFGGLMGGDKDKEYRSIGASVPSNIDQTLKNISDLNKIGTTQDIANSNTAIQSYVMNLEKLKNQGGFKNKTEAEKLINELKGAGGNSAKIAEIFADLDQLGEANRSILGGNKTVAKGKVDDHLGGKATGYVANEDFKPLTERVKSDKFEDGSKKLTIDNNTQIYIKSDGSLKNDSDETDLITHLVDKDKTKTMKFEDIMPWLKENNIGKDDPDRVKILSKINLAIDKLEDKDGNKISKTDYFIQKGDDADTVDNTPK